jgi:hypothetical protein
MDCKNHPRIPITLALELLYVIIEHALGGRTLYLDEGDFIT